MFKMKFCLMVVIFVWMLNMQKVRIFHRNIEQSILYEICADNNALYKCFIEMLALLTCLLSFAYFCCCSFTTLW